MVIHPDFIFVHMVKTGGTFLQDYFGKYFDSCRGTGRGHRRHHPASEVRDIGTFKFGVIRNPFSWYVSWWAFLGNQSKPGNTFPQFVTNDFNETLRNADKMTGIVEQTSSPLTIDFDLLNKFDIGIMTYKMLETFCDYEAVSKQGRWNGFYSRQFLVDKFIHIENFYDELIQMFEDWIYPMTPEQIEGLRTMNKVNESNHDHYKQYYDDTSREWVAHKERHVLKLFNYNWKREECGT